jgi:hypothetical protein
MAPNTESKKYDEVIVIALLVALKEKGGTMNPTLQLMSDLNGFRSASSFEHTLRSANKLAGSILAQKQAGHPVTMLGSVTTSTLASSPATPKSTKRSKLLTIVCIFTYSLTSQIPKSSMIPVTKHLPANVHGIRRLKRSYVRRQAVCSLLLTAARLLTQRLLIVIDEQNTYLKDIKLRGGIKKEEGTTTKTYAQRKFSVYTFREYSWQSQTSLNFTILYIAQQSLNAVSIQSTANPTLLESTRIVW